MVAYYTVQSLFFCMHRLSPLDSLLIKTASIYSGCAMHWALDKPLRT